MGTYRIYPTKSNTLIETNPLVNTGENEVFELWYGKKLSTRHLIQFDFVNYNAQLASGLVPQLSAATSVIKFYPCHPILENDQVEFDDEATSFDLEIYEVTRDWDQGTGNFYEGSNLVTNGFSCWNSATTIQAWTTAGGDYSRLIFSGHVDVNNEAFSASPLNSAIFQTATTYGYILKYSDAYEALTGSTYKYISKYFGQNTKTYLKPHIEVKWTDTSTGTGSTTMSSTTDYYLSLPNIKSEYSNDTITYLYPVVYPAYTSTAIIADNLQYKIVLLDGKNEHIMIDWTDVEYTNTQNRILLNTSWFMIDNNYKLEFRTIENSIFVKELPNSYTFKVTE